MKTQLLPSVVTVTRTIVAKLTSCLLLAIGVGGTPAVSADLTITTGGESGTYIKFGNDIARVARKSNITLHVETSQGSVQNLERLLGYQGSEENKYYQLAIIQEDVLSSLRRHARSDPILEGIVDRIKVVMPLYLEEVHIFGRKSLDEQVNTLRRLSDLKNEVVSVGTPLSGTFITSRLLFELAGLDLEKLEWDQLGGTEGLEALKEEDTDALFAVAGAPATLGRKYVSATDNLTLVNIENHRIFDHQDSPYERVTITPAQYPWLTAPVETAGVPSLLVAYDYDEGANCTAIENLTRIIVTNIDALRQDGHEKWRKVDPSAYKKRNDIYKCALRALETAVPRN